MKVRTYAQTQLVLKTGTHVTFEILNAKRLNLDGFMNSIFFWNVTKRLNEA